MSRDELQPIVDEEYAHTSYSARAEKLDEVFLFLTRMQAGDVVVTASRGRLFLGEVAGEARFVQSEDGRSNLRRDVGWNGPPEGVDLADLPRDVASRLQAQHDVLDLTQQLTSLQSLLAGAPVIGPDTVAALSIPDATAELADGLYVDQAWLQRCVDLLRDRPQLIFYGPPGTGKTYLGQKIAKHIAGDNVSWCSFTRHTPTRTSSRATVRPRRVCSG